MSINPQFLTYFQKEFFGNNPEEFELFRKSLLRPLKKTIRINTNQVDISHFIEAKTKEGWTFTPTPNGHVFHVDRTERTEALGSTKEHLGWDFYIQELSASMSVWHLSDGNIHSEPLSILEMAASPGGKTTQLAEHYPNSFIVANEFTKDRINALIENVERMQTTNIAITNANGVQFRDIPESFDLVLLDAPCSGEGIGFKASESLSYWNIKNVKTIARLQSKLLHAGLETLKTWGTLLYSTCTLNKIENEWVLESAKETYGDAIEIAFAKRFWPHKEVAGGFFVAKITKKSPLPEKTPKYMLPNAELIPLVGRDLTTVEKALMEANSNLPQGVLYRYKNDILFLKTSTPEKIKELLGKLYVIRFGKRIGRLGKEWFLIEI